MKEDMDKSRCSATSEQTMQPSVDRLQETFMAAQEARRKVEGERDSERNALMASARGEIDRQIAAKYDGEFRRLLQAERDARAALDEAKIGTGAAKLVQLPQNIIIEYKTPKNRWTGRVTGPPEPTGRRGRYDVWRPDSEYPLSERYGMPEVGEVFIRLLKKDDTPSARYVKRGDWKSGKWLPEGTVPQTDE